MLRIDNPFIVREFPEARQYGSHMVATSVVKEPKYKYLNIDTRFSDDFSGFDNATYTVMLPERLTNIKSMTVMNVEVFLSYFNISAAKGNNTFCITDVGSGFNTIVIIPDGQYTAAGLQSLVSGLLPSGFSFNLNSEGRSVFTNLSSNTYLINFNVDFNSDTKLTPKFKLGWLFGYRKLYYYINSDESAISEFFLNLNTSRYLYLVVDEFQNGKSDSFVSVLSSSLINKQIIARISISDVDYSFGSIINANLVNGLLVSDTRTYGGNGSGKIDIQQLNVQLVDETGAVVDLNGDDVSFCLRLEYE